MKNKQLDDCSVSEVVGILLILIFAVVASAGLYMSILSDQGPMEETFVKVKGFIEGTNIILEHQGGEAIPDDSLITIALPGENVMGAISDFLHDLNKDGKWNIGERLTKDFTYNLSRLHEYTIVEIMATDTTSNSIKFMGPLEFKPVSDTGIKVTVNNPAPSIGETVQITITVTSYGGDVDGSGGVVVKCLIPEGLEFIDYFSPTNHGSYNISSGLWDVGNIFVGIPAVIKINCTVLGIQVRENTQFAILLDGSGSISSSDWSIMRTGLSNAIKDPDIFPNDGSIELTVIQFGGWTASRSWAQVELGGPKIITNSNYITVGNNILNIGQLSGGTAMSCAFRLAADILSGDENGKLIGTSFQSMASPNSDWDRQVIILVTDGQPNIIYLDSERYKGSHTGFGSQEFILGQANSEEARDYLLNLLNMDENNDELNSIAVGPGPDIDWLNNSIIWPEPGYVSPPFDQGTGWVSHVNTWTEFVQRLEESFRILFYGINNAVELHASTTIDPNSRNNVASVTILPKD
ncbi:MAG: VWA domain-containing protein [Candidatus Thermoplasmatota archaeon]|nr:VWA domain-containing protein [Candidatus Thermoplasmatota archaeon]